MLRSTLPRICKAFIYQLVVQVYKSALSFHSILAYSEYAEKTIGAVESKWDAVLTKYIWPFGSKRNSELLATTFQKSFSILTSSLDEVRLHARSSSHNLDQLNGQLRAIHEILLLEDDILSTEQSEVLAQLWTRLGGNRAQSHRFEKNLQLLNELKSYRTRARDHVRVALDALGELYTGMHALRGRASAPEVSGTEIPMEAHLAAIRLGINRMKENRLLANKKEERALGEILGPAASNFVLT